MSMNGTNKTNYSTQINNNNPKMMAKDEVIPILDERSDSEVAHQQQSPQLQRRHVEHEQIEDSCRRCRRLAARRRLRKRFLKPWFVLGCGAILFTIFCIIVGITAYLMTSIVKYPGLTVTGIVVGNVSANLGTLGNITLQPVLDVNLHVKL